MKRINFFYFFFKAPNLDLDDDQADAPAGSDFSGFTFVENKQLG